MSRFEEGYTRLCSERGVSQELRPLLERAYKSLHVSPPNLSLVKEAIVELLSFLCQPQNRTDPNCWAVDLFFCIDDHWDTRWDTLPQPYQDLLDDIGGALHDTISAPTIAENFESTPEQLLARTRQLKS